MLVMLAFCWPLRGRGGRLMLMMLAFAGHCARGGRLMLMMLVFAVAG